FIDSHNLAKVKVIHQDNTRIRYLSKEEEKALLAALSSRDAQLRESQPVIPIRGHQAATAHAGRYVDYLEPLVVMAMHTGLRKNELLTLRW
ncbi:integrase, partial [Vibrio cincinnatiensis]